MNKVALNIRFKMGYQLPWVLWYIIIYLLVMPSLSYGLFKTELINSSSGSLVYRVWGLVIFQLVVSLRFKEDFDLWLTLSSTRKEIFQSLIGVALAFSTLFSGLIILERLIVDYLNNHFGFQNVTDPLHFFAPYVTGNLFLQFIYFLMLSIFSSILGLLLGTVFYRYGKLFRLAFWIGISSILVLIVPLFFWSYYQQHDISGFMSNIGTYLNEFNVLASSGYLLILTLALGAATYLNMRTLPQK